MPASSDNFQSELLQELERLFAQRNFLSQRIETLLEDHRDYLDHVLNEDSFMKSAEDDVIAEESQDQDSLLVLLIEELKCIICFMPMIGSVQRPLMCLNGHACCSRCVYRLSWDRGTCPTCREPIRSWGRCLMAERIGDLMVERGLLSLPTETEESADHLEREEHGLWRSARRHLEILGSRENMLQEVQEVGEVPYNQEYENQHQNQTVVVEAVSDDIYEIVDLHPPVLDEFSFGQV